VSSPVAYADAQREQLIAEIRALLPPSHGRKCTEHRWTLLDASRGLALQQCTGCEAWRILEC
jgi:hypothetical protein